jgi:hypothetical protein
MGEKFVREATGDAALRIEAKEDGVSFVQSDTEAFKREAQSEATGISIRFDAKRIAKAYFLTFLLLFGAGLLAVVYRYQFMENAAAARWVAPFEVDDERTLGNWFSVILLAQSSLAATVLYLKTARGGGTYRLHWLGLSILFGMMSIEEVVDFHARISGPLSDLLNTSGLLTYAWVLPAMVFVGLFCITFARFWWSLPARTRGLMFAAGAAYLGGAIVVEMMEGLFIPDTIENKLLAWLEEAGEMIGAIVLLYALLTYFAGNRKAIDLTAMPR